MYAIWPWQDRNRRFSWLKASVFGLTFLPPIWLAYQVHVERFGLFPLAGMTYWSGVWATALLLMALAITPLATIFRWSQFIVIRRMVGVTGLVYTIAHLIIYFALRVWDFGAIANEVVTRISLIVATLSTIGLIALGATSLDTAVQRMGAKGWKRLHNTVYVLTALAIVHYLLSPGIYPTQYSMSGMFFWLMAWRALDHRGLGSGVKALAMLAVASCLFTAFLEAGWIWVYQGFEPLGTFANNFSLDLGLSPAWQLLALGLFIAAAALAQQALRLRMADFGARKTG